jgi:soluble P-type ATPase
MEERPGLRIAVPEGEMLDLRYLLLDLNGTLALDGRPLPGVIPALREVSRVLSVRILTADTFGTSAQVAAAAGVPVEPLPPGRPGGPAKEAVVRALGASRVAAMGNGVNDGPMLAAAALGIAVLGPEGLARPAWEAARLVVPDPLSGLELFLYPDRLVATLRA